VLEHAVLHNPVLALHWYWPHEIGVAGAQLPEPSQVGAGSRESSSVAGTPLMVPETAGAQVGDPHEVPELVNWQAPEPLQAPVLPQGGLVPQDLPAWGGWLAAMLLHVPTLPEIAQL